MRGPWPATPSGNGQVFPTQTVGSITYSISAAGGYCQEMIEGNNVTAWVQPGGSGTPVLTVYDPAGATSPESLNTYAFWIGVQVRWGGGGNADSGDIVQYAVLPPPPNASNWPDLSVLQGIVPTGMDATPMCPTSLQP